MFVHYLCHLRYHGFAAQVALHDTAIWAEEDNLWYARYAIKPAGGVAAVVNLWPHNALIPHCLGEILLRVGHEHADHREPLATKLTVKPGQIRHLCLARPAPRGPEIEQHVTSAMAYVVAKSDWAAVQAFAFNVLEHVARPSLPARSEHTVALFHLSYLPPRHRR